MYLLIYLNNAKRGIAQLFQAGFFHVFGSNILNKVIAFGTNILIVRFLSANEYGLFSYAYSVYSIALLFTGFGALSGVLQYCSENRALNEKKAYQQYGMRAGLLVDALLALSLFVISCVSAFPIENAGKYIALLAPLLLLDYVFQLKCVVLRSAKRNKQFSCVQCVNTASYCLLGCCGAAFGGIAGTIFGRYIAYAVSLIVLTLIRNPSQDLICLDSCRLTSDQKKEFWRYSFGTGLASIMFQMTYQIDVLVVGQLLGSTTEIANYKVATLLPEGFLFIPSSLMLFSMPYFIGHKEDRGWFRKRAFQLFVASEIVMGGIAALLVAFAPNLIVLLWGEAYLSAVLPFRIMAASLLVSPLRTICANLLAALRKTGSNLAITTLTFIANIVFTIWFTDHFGIAGAAAAVVVSSGVASASSCVMLLRHLRS